MVKFGTTKEKRLTIDIIVIRESYERRELSEIRWINENDNSVDAVTKNTSIKALQMLDNKCEVHVHTEGRIERE